MKSADPSRQSPHEKLRFLIIGAGAIGTYIGGSLLLSGYSAAFVEREETAAQVRARGLRLRFGEGERVYPGPTVFGSLEEAGQSGYYDVLIVAVKSYDTLNLAQAVARAVPAFGAVLSVQNGVENERLLATHLGEDRVIAGVVTSAVSRVEAGNVVLERLRGVGIASGNPLSAEIVTAFNAAGLNARLYDQAQSMKWSKMLINLLANATAAILDMTPAEILADKDLYALEVSQIREALEVMAALDIPVSNLPGAPVRLLAAMLTGLPLWLSRPIAVRALGRGRGDKMPSFHIDLHSGRKKSEVDYLNGAVVRYAQQLSLQAPVNRLLNETLLALTEGSLKIEQFTRQPGNLLARLSQYTH